MHSRRQVLTGLAGIAGLAGCSQSPTPAIQTATLSGLDVTVTIELGEPAPLLDPDIRVATAPDSTRVAELTQYSPDGSAITTVVWLLPEAAGEPREMALVESEQTFVLTVADGETVHVDFHTWPTMAEVSA